MMCSFIPTMNCNVLCAYCSMGCNKLRPNYNYSTTDDFQKLLNFLKVQGDERYEFEFFGGEPTMHPKFKEFNHMVDDFFGDQLDNIFTISNFAKPISYWKYDWPDKVKFIASYHHWYLKDKQDEWFKKIYSLAKLGKMFCVRFVVTEENEYEVLEAFNTYKRDDLGIDIWEIVLDEWSTNEEWLSKFDDRDDVDSGINIDRKNFYKMMCNCRFRVLENGDVYHCWNKANDPSCKPILNVFKDEPFKVPEWHLCTTKYDCICKADKIHPKISIKEYARIQNEI